MSKIMETDNQMFIVHKRYHRVLKIISKLQQTKRHIKLLHTLLRMSTSLKYDVNVQYGVVTQQVTKLYNEGDSEYVRHIGKMLSTCDGDTLPLGIDKVDDLKECRHKVRY